MLFGIIFIAAVSSCNNQTEKAPQATAVKDTAKPAEDKNVLLQSACFIKKDTFNVK